jgi:hypothetical protein
MRAGHGDDPAVGSRPDGFTTMTRDYDAEPVRSQEEFEAALAAVIEAAVTEGVDVRGAWEFQTRGSTHSWEVEIIELAKSFDLDEE